MTTKNLKSYEINVTTLTSVTLQVAMHTKAEERQDTDDRCPSICQILVGRYVRQYWFMSIIMTWILIRAESGWDVTKDIHFSSACLSPQSHKVGLFRFLYFISTAINQTPGHRPTFRDDSGLSR